MIQRRKRHLTKVSVTPTSVRNSWDQGPQGPGQLGFAGQIWKVFAGFSSSKAKLDDLSLPIITYLININ